MPNEVELLDILLSNRQISQEERERFLNPSYESHMNDPFLMKDMERICVRIFEAVEGKEKIVLYGDYDCDGIPALVIMNDFFKKIGYENYSIYIPDRHDEGYGLNSEAIKEFITSKVNLIITFDLGITAINEVIEAEVGGVDVIITDHHLPHRQTGLPHRQTGLPHRQTGLPHQKTKLSQEELPHAYAILDPKQEECAYPEKELCGAGVAFKLVQALVKKYGEYWKIHNGWEKWTLDMAGIATLSDQVSLLGENRVIAYYGIKVLQKGKRPGLSELFRSSSVDIIKANEEDITFTLAPRINAASRMADPMKAFELLSTTDITESRVLSDHLLKINDERKIMVAHIMKEVKSTLRKREEKPIVVIGNPSWRIGVLGIVAAKIAEEYKKPAFVWGGDGNNNIRGSCRSFGTINIFEMMSTLPDGSLSEFGGHRGAGGFSVSHEEIHFLEDRLLAVYENMEMVEGEENDYLIDAPITLDDVTDKNYNIIKKMAPFGLGNPKPTFLLKNIKISAIKEFGKEKNHLELSFKDSRGRIIKAISFFKNRESFNYPLVEGDNINLVATFERNTFGGRDELRLRIVDII